MALPDALVLFAMGFSIGVAVRGWIADAALRNANAARDRMQRLAAKSNDLNDRTVAMCRKVTEAVALRQYGAIAESDAMLADLAATLRERP